MDLNGITPGHLWTFLIVLVGMVEVLAAVYGLIEKVDARREKRDAASKAHANGIDTKISTELAQIRAEINDISAHIRKIDEFLDSDKRRIEALETAQNSASKGFAVLCSSSLALVEHMLHNGNADQLEDAKESLIKYLTEQK